MNESINPIITDSNETIFDIDKLEELHNIQAKLECEVKLIIRDAIIRKILRDI